MTKEQSYNLEEITFIIPTYNRPLYLKRTLEYFNLCAINSPIVIVDSSSKTNKLLNSETCQQYDKLKIHYYSNFPELDHPAKKVIYALDKVFTEYIHFVADDDFVCFSTVEHSLKKLEATPDANCCQGIQCIVENKSCTRTLRFSLGTTIDLDQEAANIRSQIGTVSGFTFFYSLMRTSVVKDVLHDFENYGLIFGSGLNQSNLCEHAYYRSLLTTGKIISCPLPGYIRDISSDSVWKSKSKSHNTALRMLRTIVNLLPNTTNSIICNVMIYRKSFSLYEICRYYLIKTSCATSNQAAEHIASDFAYSKINIPFKNFSIKSSGPETTDILNIAIQTLFYTIFTHVTSGLRRLLPTYKDNNITSIDYIDESLIPEVKKIMSVYNIPYM